MALSSKEFSRQLKTEQGVIIGVRFLNFKKMLASELVKRVVPRTPVREGLARGNWQIGIGSPPSNFLDVRDPTGSSTISAALTKIQSAPLGADIFLVNNAPHAKFLENGSSKQAPRGMLAISLQELDVQFRGVL